MHINCQPFPKLRTFLNYTMCMYPTGRKINEKVLRLKSNLGLIEI